MASLFDFAKNIGKKLFNKEDEDAAKAERIKQSLSVLGLPAINVSYTEGQVTLSGKASTPEQKEKAILMTGNVEGVEKVNADALEAPAQQAVQVDYYIIQSGDTLSKIAQRFYGNASAYPKIFEANREVIEDPNKIYPGQKIRIPGVSQTTA